MCTPARASMRECRAIGDDRERALHGAAWAIEMPRPGVTGADAPAPAKELALAIEDPPQQIEVGRRAIRRRRRSQGRERRCRVPRAPGAARQELLDRRQHRVLIADKRQVIDRRAARRTSRRECATRGSALPRPSGSDRRCDAGPASARGSIGSTSRMSISAFMRVNATAAPGLAPMRRYAAHHSRNAGSWRHRRRALVEADRPAPFVDDGLAEAIALLARRAPRIVRRPTAAARSCRS